MPEITRQPTPDVSKGTSGAINPADYLPEMAKANMAKEAIARMGTPAIVSKRFVVCEGIFEALNHKPEKPTGYDCSLRLEVYRHVKSGSINVDGKYFNNLWAYLMTSIYTINQQVVPTGNAFDNQEPGIARRLWNRITGQGQEQKTNG